MSFLLRTSRLPFTRTALSARPFSTTFQQLAAQGYGDPVSGDPVGGNPSAQGASNGTKHAAEHPGPAPPAEGKGSGGGPTKGSGAKSNTAKSPEDASAQSGGSRSKEAKETGSSPTGGKVKKGKSGGGGQAQPKILDPRDYEKSPGEEARKHNEEFKKGHEHGDRNV